MAIFTQSPPGQTTTNLSLGSISLDTAGTVTQLIVNPVVVNMSYYDFTIVPGGANVDIDLTGGGSQPQLPTSGQIWPTGFLPA